jgi:hypothetical protein
VSVLGRHPKALRRLGALAGFGYDPAGSEGEQG